MEKLLYAFSIVMSNHGHLSISLEKTNLTFTLQISDSGNWNMMYTISGTRINILELPAII